MRAYLLELKYRRTLLLHSRSEKKRDKVSVSDPSRAYQNSLLQLILTSVRAFSEQLLPVSTDSLACLTPTMSKQFEEQASSEQSTGQNHISLLSSAPDADAFLF